MKLNNNRNLGASVFGVVVSMALVAMLFGPALANKLTARNGSVELQFTQPEGFGKYMTVFLLSTESKRYYKTSAYRDFKFRSVRPGEYEVNVLGTEGVLMPFAGQRKAKGETVSDSGVPATVITVKENEKTKVTVNLTGQMAPHRAVSLQLFLDGETYPKAYFNVGKGDPWQWGRLTEDGRIKVLLFDSRKYTHLSYDGGVVPIQIPAEGAEHKIEVATGSLRVALPNGLEVPGRTNLQVQLTEVTTDGSDGQLARFSDWTPEPGKTPEAPQFGTKLAVFDHVENELVVHGVLPGKYRAEFSVTHQTQALGASTGSSPKGAKKVDHENLHKTLFEGKAEVSIGASEKTDLVFD